MTTPMPGTQVKFVGGPYGLVDAEVSLYKFTSDDSARDGDVGTIVDRTADEFGQVTSWPEGWLLVKHERTGLYCPVHHRMIKVIP